MTTINTNLDAIREEGNVRAYRIALLAQLLEKIEASEGRTNRAYISTLEMLIDENTELIGFKNNIIQDSCENAYVESTLYNQLKTALGRIAHFITTDEMNETHHSKHTDQSVRDKIIGIARNAIPNWKRK